MQENYPDIDIFLVQSARNHALWNAYIAEKWDKKHGKCRMIPTPRLKPTPYPSPEIVSKYRVFGVVVKEM